VNSRSDARGLLGMTEADGTLVYPGPNDLQVRVRIGAHDVPPECLHALVEQGMRRSPIPCAVRNAGPLSVQVEIVAG
jgi:hypothetical protein